MSDEGPEEAASAVGGPRPVRFFLCGDVMPGRGIDQVLPHPSAAILYEEWAASALDYVALAERLNGPIPRPVDFAYVWGEALAEIDARTPAFRIVNLETSVTSSATPVPKGINYRMNPANVPCLAVARIDCCALANNHVLDWGTAGLLETIETLRSAGIAAAGAGRDAATAAQPAILRKPAGPRALVFSFACMDSGVPPDWAATPSRPGVRLLRDLAPRTVDGIAAEVVAQREPGDLVVVSIHWGGNWGYTIPASQRAFAHGLIDAGAADIVHGHSSHHPKGIEVYEERIVLYGCGDFLTDYEGIGGHGQYRPEVAVAYFPELDSASGRLLGLEMVTFRSVRFRLVRTSTADAIWLRDVLDREGERLGTAVTLSSDGTLRLQW